jgi:hypothetical protein
VDVQVIVNGGWSVVKRHRRESTVRNCNRAKRGYKLCAHKVFVFELCVMGAPGFGPASRDPKTATSQNATFIK